MPQKILVVPWQISARLPDSSLFPTSKCFAARLDFVKLCPAGTTEKVSLFEPTSRLQKSSETKSLTFYCSQFAIFLVDLVKIWSWRYRSLTKK